MLWADARFSEVAVSLKYRSPNRAGENNMRPSNCHHAGMQHSFQTAVIRAYMRGLRLQIRTVLNMTPKICYYHHIRP